jgi:uncharacterized protein (TIGR02265 family)
VSDPATTRHTVFDALFLHLLQPQGAFKDELRAAGYDPDRPLLRYPTSVLLATLDIAARHVYPELPREEAHRTLGRRFADRYLATVLGRLTRKVVLALGADKFLMQIPRIVPISSTGVTVAVKRVGPGEFQLVYTGESQPPDFVAGALEGGAEDSSILGLRAQIVRREPGEFELKVTVAGK